MADVLIVCVREDEPKAKALAEMFEAAGFSIGGAPSSDGALRSSGAGLVVWSQASIRSRPFLDAAQRVINAEKAVVASLIEPPPPSSIGSSPVFDLTLWDGDPNDPALDPLFFAVDRMVNAARAAVGASAAQAAYAPPPEPAPPPRPAPRAAPPPSEPNYVRTPGVDPLGSEAEHWRAIRDSRNPSDFMDYLARYGPEGAFAEVAELRLKQLTQAPEPRMPTPPPMPPRAAAPARPLTPPPRPEAPPPRRAEAPRRIDPPPRRPEPVPPTRRPPDRYFDRADLREPPRSESGGGALRAFILVALLGGAALAGGLYFGGGMGDSANAPNQQTEDVAAVTPPSDIDQLDEPVGVPIDGSAAPERPQRTESARPDQRTREPERPRQEARREEPRQATPAPTITPPATSGGPVSLSPPSQQASNAGGTTPNFQMPTPAAIPPAPAPTQTASANTQRPAQRAQGTVQWAQRPSGRRVAELYPSRAQRNGIGGRVQLNCSVRSNQTLACAVASESPAGQGFGEAALQVANSYRAQPTLSDGSVSTGASANLSVTFQPPR